MFWALIIIAGCVALIKFPRVRKVAYGITALLASVLVDTYSTTNTGQVSRRDWCVLNNWRSQKCVSDRNRLAPVTGSSVGSRTIRGIPVFDIQTRIQILDCDRTSHCDIVGEEERILGPVIPPGQVRDIEESIYFIGGAHVRVNFQWNYTIIQVRAHS